jgi:hypothetical protein
MTTHVTDRLERLSAEAPTHLGEPGELWRRGRRRQARHWLAGAASLVVLAVLGGTVAGPLLAPDRVEVAATKAATLRLPDVIRGPGEWEPAFEGPPGPLVAVGVGTRAGLLTSRTAWWGVSGVTGEARFLDLPDAAVGVGSPALSDDGRRIAYWSTGPTTGEPLIAGDYDPPVGVAVLDLVTGDVRRWDTSTPHGLMTTGLAWAGDVLWWTGGDYATGGTDEERGGESSARVAAHTWDLGTDERRTHRVPDVMPTVGGSIPGGMLVPGRGTSLRLVEGDEVTGSIGPDRGLAVQSSGAPALNAAGLLAGIEQEDSSVTDWSPHPVLVGRVDPDTGSVRLAEVGDVRALAVLGWRSPREVVIETSGPGGERVRAEVVDVDSGASRVLAGISGGAPVTFASQVWSAPVVAAPAAPFAPDRRLVGVALAGAVLLLVRAGLAVRRRRGRA